VPLLRPVLVDGLPVQPESSLEQARRRCTAGLAELPADARRIADPVPALCEVSDPLAVRHAAAVAALRSPR
jgi:hypothetical protein